MTKKVMFTKTATSRGVKLSVGLLLGAAIGTLLLSAVGLILRLFASR